MTSAKNTSIKKKQVENNSRSPIPMSRPFDEILHKATTAASDRQRNEPKICDQSSVTKGSLSNLKVGQINLQKMFGKMGAANIEIDK